MDPCKSSVHDCKTSSLHSSADVWTYPSTLSTFERGDGDTCGHIWGHSCWTHLYTGWSGTHDPISSSAGFPVCSCRALTLPNSPPALFGVKFDLDHNVKNCSEIHQVFMLLSVIFVPTVTYLAFEQLKDLWVEFIFNFESCFFFCKRWLFVLELTGKRQFTSFSPLLKCQGISQAT